ncbi:uncharacterized protein LOC142776618 [Rhipicephalus microplus]|uniref:uncharacterized protein LOC142776618 n=1 Tax=Rhipicephalus microplus TaxID=6941 RepID=UPI003F6C9F5D
MSTRRYSSRNGADVRPPDSRLSAQGIECRLPGWISERDLREAGCSKGTQSKLNPVVRSCPKSRRYKTGWQQRKATAVTATTKARRHRRHSYDNNLVDRAILELGRLSLTEKRGKVIASGDGEGKEEMKGAEEAPPPRNTVAYAEGDGHAVAVDVVLGKQ